MNDQFSKRKSFGEILDHSFRLIKSNFSSFFLIFLLLLGPIYLLGALALLASGTSFFRQVGSGNNWFEQIMSGYDEALYNTSTGVDLLLGLAMIVLTPVAYAAILIALDRIRNKDDFTVSSVIKAAFSRFWPLFGSTLLYGLILFGFFIGLVMISTIVGIISGIFIPLAGIIVGVLLFLGVGLVLGLLLTRWSFYLCAVVLEIDAPGLGRSWRLTEGNTWKVFGLFIVIFLISVTINFAVEGVFMFVLGNSVLLTIIVNLVTIFTSVIIAVTYAVIYFDLRNQQDGDDLKSMVEDYKTN